MIHHEVQAQLVITPSDSVGTDEYYYVPGTMFQFIFAVHMRLLADFPNLPAVIGVDKGLELETASTMIL
jgi:hypothetical protein